MPLEWYLNPLLELLTALLEYFDEIYCIYKSLITIIVTNAVGINGMRAGDGKQGINKCWPNHNNT